MPVVKSAVVCLIAALCLAPLPMTIAAAQSAAPVKPAPVSAPINPKAPAAAATQAVAPADPITAAIAFAKGVTSEATAALTAKNATQAQQLDNFQGVLNKTLALDVIGKFMLGESRKKMNPAQVARYDAIFPDYITKQYAEQFQEIIGRPLEVVDAKAIGAKDVVVRTRFTRSAGSPVNVDWRVRQLKSGEQKAIDIIVSGVSIMLVKREEFTSYIAKNGVDPLLARLEAEVAG